MNWGSWVQWLSAKAWELRPAYSLAVFRIGFGAILAFAPLRFWYRGWISELYLAPQFHFTYAWFPWVKPLPSWAMHGAFALLFLLGVSVCAGYRARTAAALYGLIFTYVELIEKAAYLNH